MRGRLSKILIVLLSVGLAAVGLGALAVKIAFDGGIENTIRKLKAEPDPASASIQSARDRLENQLKSILAGIASTHGFTGLGDAKDDRCYRGQNNYKVTEGFAYRCTLRVTRFFGFDSDFRQTALDLENGLIKSRWNIETRSRGDRMERRLVESYDRYNRTVDRFSAPDYHRFPTHDTSDLRLKIQWAEKTTEKHYWLDNLQKSHGGSFFRQSDYRDTPEILRKTTETHRYLIGIAVEGHYFEN
jgi:hypothetical protein